MYPTDKTTIKNRSNNCFAVSPIILVYLLCEVSHETKNSDTMRAEKNKNVNIALELFNSYVIC